MANTATTFSDYFDGLANPFVPPAAQYTGFAAIVALQPQGILASLESTQYPSVLMATRTDGTPAVYLAPFSAATLPGVAPPTNKFAFYGDFSQAGNPPALLSLTANFFHLAPNAVVLPAADAAAAWAAAPAGSNLLAPPAPGVATEQVQTRNSMPVPHEYTRAVIIAYGNGLLTWEWIWTNVVVPILADAQQAVDLLPFVEYVQAAMTQRAPAATGGPIRASAPTLDLSAVNTTPSLQDQAMSKAREFLPGLRQPVGMGAQLNLIAQQQLTQGGCTGECTARPPTYHGTKGARSPGAGASSLRSTGGGSGNRACSLLAAVCRSPHWPLDGSPQVSHLAFEIGYCGRRGIDVDDPHPYDGVRHRCR